MNFKALLSLSLAVLMGLSAAGCGHKSTEATPVSSDAGQTAGSAAGVFTLAYSSTDTLNPYTAVTKSNQELSQLLFDPLLKLDDSFQPVYVLAEGVQMEGAVCTVKLKDVKFSDGSAVTAEDVTYSIQKARESNTRYKTQAEAIKSASAAGASTVRVTFQKADPYGMNLLDFPIIKKGSDTRTDADNRTLPPIGSGRYTYDMDAKTLTANPSYVGGHVNISGITLVDAPDNEALEHALEVGSLSFYYTDLSDNVLPKMTGKSQNVPMNNLVYLGVNFTNGWLSVPEIRQAVSAALDRSALAESAYYGHALPASSPYPSVWTDAAAMGSLPLTQNTEQVVANLEKVGYNEKDSDGYWVNAGGRRITLTLLCNVDNAVRVKASNLIKEQLAAAGIEVNVRSVNFDAYSAEVAAGSFDLYLGEVKLMNNMDVSQLVTYGGSAAYGLPAPVSSQPSTSSAPASSDTSGGNASRPDGGSAPTTSGTTPAAVQPSAPTTAQVLEAYYKGEAMLSEVSAAFMAELPVIPLCHRCGQVTYSSKLAVGPASTVSDVFFGMESCSFAS